MYSSNTIKLRHIRNADANCHNYINYSIFTAIEEICSKCMAILQLSYKGRLRHLILGTSSVCHIIHDTYFSHQQIQCLLHFVNYTVVVITVQNIRSQIL